MKGAGSCRSHLRVLVLALVLGVGLAHGAPPAHAAPPAADPKAWGQQCSAAALGLDDDTVQLAPAPLPERPDTNPDGSPVRLSPDARGRYTPVIMVHGWISRSTHDTERTGTFSGLIDLTANRVVPVAETRSLIGQLQRVPGAAVFTFDYRDYAARWVDDPHLGPALGKVIDCLYRESGEKVIVVGHSMGGLVARYAASSPGPTGPDRANEISTVITLGTPEQGSVAALLTAATLDASSSRTIAVLRLVLAACGRLSSRDVRTGSLCDGLPPPVRTFASDAGVALRYGSPQLAALKPFPRSVALDALAGDAAFDLPKAGWFHLPWDTTSVDVGDLIVTHGSAVHGAANVKQVSCAYQLNATRGATDSFALAFGLASAVDVAEQPLASFAGPCFHTQLMRSIELTNEVTGAVNDDISSRQPVTEADLLSAPVPADCQHPAGTLVNGHLPGIAHGDGTMGLAWLDGGRPASDLLASGDLNGDGRDDAAAVLYCDAGGVAWPEIVAFYTQGPRLLGSVSLSDINLPGHEPGENAFVDTVRYHDGVVTTTWSTQQAGDPASTPTLDYSADMRWNGRKIVPVHLATVTEVDTMRHFTAAVRQGRTETATTLGTAAAATDAATAARTYPDAFAAEPTCYGLIDLGIPDVAKALIDPGASTEVRGADRLCLLPTGAGTPQYVAVAMKKTGFEKWQALWVRTI